MRTAEPEVGEADAADAADAAQQGAAPEQGADAQPAQRDGTEPEAR
ncbi:hypothetical protein [Microbacterium suwonense]|nr:hypothetical protein [Microbacterium suwonense]